MKRVFNLVYEKYREAIVYVALSLYLIVGVVNTSVLQYIRVWFLIAKACSALCALIFCSYFLIDFIKGKFKITPFLIISVICAVGIVIFAHDASLCFFIVLLYILKKCDFSKILKYGSLALLSGLVFIMILSLIGVIDNPIHTRGNVARATLGFQSAVLSSLWFFCFCITYNSYRKEKISYLELLLEIFINCLLYYFTDTRGGTLLCFIIILGTFFLKIFSYKSIGNSKCILKIKKFFGRKKLNSVLKILFVSLPVLITLGFTVLVALYGTKSGFILKINNLLSDRLRFTYNAFHERKITIFGGVYNWVDNDGVYKGVDMAFYHYFFNIGLVGACYMLIISMLLCLNSYKEKQHWLCFVLFLLLVDGLIDSLFYNIHYNLFLLSLIGGDTGNKILFGENKKNTIGQKFLITDEDRINLDKLKLSIIVPVYNSEKFIRKCVDKLLQINLNKEIIVINDCSSDNSLRILQSYYDQIVLINLQENKGVSYARNAGLQRATGDYVTFVDVDDDFEMNMHTKMLSKMIREQAEVCICQNDIIETNGKVLNNGCDFSWEELTQGKVIAYYLCGKIVPAVWNCVYKTSLAKTIQFNEQLSIGEDILYVLQILLSAKKTSFVNEVLYHYVQYQTSAMHNLSDKLLEYLKVAKSLTSAETNVLNDKYQEEFNYFKLEMIKRSVHSISLNAKSDKQKAKNMLKSILTLNVCNEVLKNKYFSKAIKLEFFILKHFGINFHLFVFPMYGLVRKVLRG